MKLGIALLFGILIPGADHGQAALANSSKPLPRYQLAMAYDADRQVIVLFGGYQGGKRFGDIWEWAGEKWVQKGQYDSIARSVHSMVYDKTRKKIVLFGGGIGGGTPLEPKAMNDTWEWDGREWKQRQ